MKEMEVFRIEKLEFRLNGRYSIHDFKAIINKTQDLTVLKTEVMKNAKGLVFTVRRKLECLPDTIKRGDLKCRMMVK